MLVRPGGLRTVHITGTQEEDSSSKQGTVLPVDYPSIYESLLEPIGVSKSTISTEKLFASPELGGVKRATKLKHLKAFLGQRPEFIGVVDGVLPNSAGLLDLIVQQLGSAIHEGNVVQANRACAQIVLKAARPVVASYVRTSLDGYISGPDINVPIYALIEFLVGDFSTFSRGAGNGLVSVAGSMNEELLIACLQHAGMASGTDFTKTGTDSEADILVHSHAAGKHNLGVEVKSYHARERLLRGLQDIKGAKVGAGYFVDPSEFNSGRTKTLLQTQAAAIYMPGATLADLPADVRDMRTNAAEAFQSRFYRPLERFASDMKAFTTSGELPGA